MHNILPKNDLCIFLYTVRRLSTAAYVTIMVYYLVMSLIHNQYCLKLFLYIPGMYVYSL